MPLKNGAPTIKRAVDSVFLQRGLKRELQLLIVNDNSNDNWYEEIIDYIGDPRIVIEDVNFGEISKVRNHILEYAKKRLSSQSYIGRLDVDDIIIDEFALSKIEVIIDKYNPDVIIAGNKQSLKGKLLDRINYADKRLINHKFLEKKLYQMSRGDPEGELPSCNVFVKNSVDLLYKLVESAEDHWYTVDLLLNNHKYDIYIAHDLLYANYSLNGNITNINKDRKTYLRSRQQLLDYYSQKSKIIRDSHANKER